VGAGSGRVIRQGLTESLVLASAGGALGLVLSYWTADALARFAPFGFAVSFRPDVWVLGFAVLLTGLTTALFGLLPALQTSRVDAGSVLKGTARAASGMHMRSVLVVAQVALSLVLVVAAGLFARSLSTASGIELGFERENRVLIGVNLANHGYEPVERREFIRTVLARVRAVPAVQAVGTTVMIPFNGGWTGTRPVQGYVNSEGTNQADLGTNSVSPGYFEAMGIPLLAGRTFEDSDDGVGGHAMIVNETTADRIWPGESPLGKIVGGEEDLPEWTVVGVVADAQYYELGEEPETQAYVSALDNTMPSVNFVVEHSGDPAVVRRVQEEILSVDQTIAITRVLTMEDAVDSEIGRFRVAATLVGFFSILALTLASAGLYGVLSHMVALRVREIGIRMALGASVGEVGRGVLGRGLRLALWGIALGTAVSIAGTRLLTGFLYGVEPRDPVTMVGVPIVLLFVAGLASVIPAWRATRVDPIEALRAD